MTVRRLAQFGFSSLEFSGTSELESSRDTVFDFGTLFRKVCCGFTWS